MRIDQADWNSPTLMKGARRMVKGSRCPHVHCPNTVQATAHEKNSRPVVTACDGMLPIRRPKKPAIAAPTSGAKTPRMTRV